MRDGGGDGGLPDADALFDDAACGLLLTDDDGTIRRVNRTFCNWIGARPDALVDRRRFQDLLTVGGRIFHQTHWAPLLQIQGSVAEVKLELDHADGRKVPMMLNALRRSVGARVVHELALFVAEDRHRYERELLAARKRAEELLAQQRVVELALQESQAELHRQKLTAEDRAAFAEQMVGIVSHDLRNPLSAIQLSALLLARGELTPQQHKAVARIRSSTERAQRLIADLLDFTVAKIGRGLTMTPAPIDLHKLVADAAEELRLTFAERALTHRAVGEGACRADADRLTQAIGNLVANAMTYGAADGTVAVTSRIGADTFTVEVHNEGDAIDADRIDGLFDPMTRGVGATNSGRSVGLGLFVVREIARAHGGEVAVTSTVEDGTTFAIRLPR